MNILLSSGVERSIAERQLATKSNKSNSRFIYTKGILKKYGLPSIYDLLDSPVKKEVWKKKMKTAIHNFWTTKIISDTSSKSTLKYLAIQYYRVVVTHNIWTDASNEAWTHKLSRKRVSKQGWQLGPTCCRHLGPNTLNKECLLCVSSATLGMRILLTFSYHVHLWLGVTLCPNSVYANYFYDTSDIFSNSFIT